MELIDKSEVVKEIEKRLHANGAFDEVGDEAWSEDVGMCNAYKSILSFLNTLEVKDVDLDLEITLLANAIPEIRLDDVERLAKYFFELGLKTKKGGKE